MTEPCQDLHEENESLRKRLKESEELLSAIHAGDVDALVVSGPEGDRIFTIEGADHAYRVLVESMSEGAVTLAYDGTILYCNRSFAEMVRASLDKVTGKPISSFIVSDDQEAFNALLRGQNRGEIRIRAEDKSFLPAFLSISPLQIEGSKESWSLLVTDLREQKKSEEIVASEKLARAIIEQAAEAIIVCDEQGRIIRFSNAASRICRRDLLLHHFDDAFDLHVSIQDEAGERIYLAKEALQGSVLLRIEVQFRRVDDRLYHLMLNAGPLKNAEGNIIGCVITLTDISVCKRVEKDLRDATDNLELRVEERTKELQNAKDEQECINEELRLEINEHEKTEVELMKAKDAAEEAARTKAEFMANMSHEIRTPMNAVLGLTGLLLDEEDLKPEHREFLEIIHASGNSLLAIINDILDFSRMEREKVELEYQPFDLRACIEESLDLVASEAGQKDIDLACFIKDVPDVVITDPTRLRQVLSNLLGNAVKFTSRGEVVVSVSSSPEGLSDEIHFAVRDTGIGIPTDKFDLIFQPFCQADTSTTRNYGGTGLGLAISKRLVERLGGRIWVESEEGRGSTFHFTIKAGAAPGVQRLESDRKAKETASEFAGKRILIVDDNRSIRKIIGKQSFSLGLLPFVTASPLDALRQVMGGDSFDLAFVDARMPEMDGISLAKELRRRNKDITLVMMGPVGTKWPKDLFFGFLPKPIKQSQLQDLLKNALTQKRSQETRNHETNHETRENPKPKSMHILLAEDNVSAQKVTLQMLKRLGYRADVAADGLEALEALERQPYDIVFMDIRMPQMNGFDATKAIRERVPKEEQPKIIAITAYALDGDREKCLQAGMDDYIGKPVVIDDIRRILEKHVRRVESQ